MRILTVSNVPLDPSLGSGYVICGYLERLRARGHEVVTLDPRDYTLWPRLRAARRLRTLFGYSRATLRAVAQSRFDLVELWGGESWRVAQTLRRRRDRPILVGRSNGLEPFARETQLAAGLAVTGVAGRAFDRWQQLDRAFTDVDALTVVSHFDAAYATARRYQPPERLLVLENPLRDDWLAQPTPSERPKVIAYFGSWLPIKGSRLLPAILADTLRSFPDWRARLVGPPAEVAAEFAPEIRTRIEFIPLTTDREKLRQLYRSSAVVLMPSIYESFGLVAAEALACDCALVASPVGFSASLRNGVEAVLVSTPTAEAWTRDLAPLLRDEKLRQTLASAGHAKVQHLRWEFAVAQLESFYARLAREIPSSLVL